MKLVELDIMNKSREFESTLFNLLSTNNLSHFSELQVYRSYNSYFYTIRVDYDNDYYMEIKVSNVPADYIIANLEIKIYHKGYYKDTLIYDREKKSCYDIKIFSDSFLIYCMIWFKLVYRYLGLES